jgi:hypothetical protein
MPRHSLFRPEARHGGSILTLARGFLGHVDQAGMISLCTLIRMLSLPSSKFIIIIFGLLVGVAPFATRAAMPTPTERRRVQEKSEEDFRRMINVLGISEPTNLPPEESDPKRPTDTHRPEGKTSGWADHEGHFVVRSAWGNWINYDEAKADTHLPLPDPLILKTGEHVTSAEMWIQRRRPEIAADFANEIYGQIPTQTPSIRWEIVESDPQALGGTAKMRRIVGHIDNSKFPAAQPTIRLTLHLPAKATGPVPVIVAIGGFEFPPGMVFPGMPTGPGALQQTIAHGWGYAKFDTLAVQADNGAGLSEGIIGLLNEGRPRQPDQWGTIAAWSWGLSRAIDYLETDSEVDAHRLAVEGHSRYGKTALYAAAIEPRWAMAYASCSGAAGAKLHRHDYGESLDIVASSGEYHWMAGNFLKYAGHWGSLPIDQHELVALVAPRPIFITGGTQDLWPDPLGMFQAAVAAGPVYRLLVKKDLGRSEMPAPDEAVIGGDIGFRYHTGGHFDVLDWPTFLAFADKYFSSSK